MKAMGGAQYLQRNVPQGQTVFRHLALGKAHGLQLNHGKQLTSRVDYLALYRHMHNQAKLCQYFI